MKTSKSRIIALSIYIVIMAVITIAVINSDSWEEYRTKNENEKIDAQKQQQQLAELVEKFNQKIAMNDGERGLSFLDQQYMVEILGLENLLTQEKDFIILQVVREQIYLTIISKIKLNGCSTFVVKTYSYPIIPKTLDNYLMGNTK